MLFGWAAGVPRIGKEVARGRGSVSSQARSSPSHASGSWFGGYGELPSTKLGVQRFSCRIELPQPWSSAMQSSSLRCVERRRIGLPPSFVRQPCEYPRTRSHRSDPNAIDSIHEGRRGPRYLTGFVHKRTGY